MRTLQRSLRLAVALLTFGLAPAAASAEEFFGEETATAKAKAIELGTFAQGPVPLRVELSVGDAARAVTVRAVRKGASLRH